jgi:exopolyphosphatase / guanosine-5'-triphosphate,3'-diphosphate pyrophosphatase
MTTRLAVIDIGSNSIRLVVYAGALRSPMPIYNEKSRVSLGSCLSKGGRIDELTMERALSAIARFHTLASAMEVDHLRVVATAATREAKNGQDLVTRAAEMGIRIDVLDGMTEAYVAGLGIVSEHPDVDGYVGDLGGGSMELARLNKGKIEERVSLPFGTLRLDGLQTQSFKSIGDRIARALSETGDFPLDRGLPFFLVGGAWRALARLHIYHNQFPLSVLSNYTMPATAPADMLERSIDKEYLLANKVVPAGRIDTLPGAIALLGGVTRLLKPSALVTSTSGLREGLLFDRLTAAERLRDPFVEAARHEGARLARFRFHGDALADWIAPLFEQEGARFDRLRRVACLLADTAWNVTPEYRGDVALSLALDGNWPGATTEDRAILAAALLGIHDHRRPGPDVLSKLAEPDALARGLQWGLAIRLAYRLDGGTGSALSDTALVAKGDCLRLSLSSHSKKLYTGSVERRLQQLGAALGFTQTAVTVNDA